MDSKSLVIGAGLFGIIGLFEFGCGNQPFQAKCEQITCNSPPLSTCLNEKTKIEYLSPGVCNPKTGLCEFKTQQITCEHICYDRDCVRDENPDDFDIIIPSQTQLCADSGGDGVHYNTKARISLNPGIFSLPKNLEERSQNWVQQVEVVPQGTLATTTSPGVVQHYVDEYRTLTIHFYEYTQTFSRDEREFNLTLTIRFEVVEGQPTSPHFYLGESSDFDPRRVSFRWMVTTDWEDYSSYFTFCDQLSSDSEHTNTIEVQVENGDRIILERIQGQFTQASFARGNLSRSAQGYFQLDTAYNHHGWGFYVLAVFEDRLDSVAAFEIDEHTQKIYYWESLDTLINAPWERPEGTDCTIRIDFRG